MARSEIVKSEGRHIVESKFTETQYNGVNFTEPVLINVYNTHT